MPYIMGLTALHVWNNPQLCPNVPMDCSHYCADHPPLIKSIDWIFPFMWYHKMLFCEINVQKEWLNYPIAYKFITMWNFKKCKSWIEQRCHFPLSVIQLLFHQIHKMCQFTRWKVILNHVKYSVVSLSGIISIEIHHSHVFSNWNYPFT